ncbi:MAG: hypothetical protein MUF05_00930 [Candidatus Omnitrophica bacterium]|jgi:epoxyqueuosine reductase QueG|nr:hypothetical protein [Candidatus Omnitrophota bacterium]
MDKAKAYLSLKKFSLDSGADVFGVCDIGHLKEELILSNKIKEKLKFAISLGVCLSSAVLEDIEDAPTRLYFHHYRSVNMFLDQLSLRVARHIQKKGFRALSIPASQIVDWQKQSAHLSHKKIAALAGIGWIGRNNLLVNKKYGSQMRLITILTDMPLKADKPSGESCGKCFSCLKICPAQAIKEKKEDFDHMKCFEKLKQFQKQRLVDQYICGVCVKSCAGEKEAK